MRFLALFAMAAMLTACGAIPMHAPPSAALAAPAPRADSVYAPYRFLIGEWNVTPASGGAPSAVARFRFGPGESYIWFSVALVDGTREDPHFEGMLMWNGARRDLDMLVALDLKGGRAQEQGRLYLEGGTVVREIVSIGPDGTRANFRQTFTQDGERRVLTSVLRQAGSGWVATFPGSDKMVMTPRG